MLLEIHSTEGKTKSVLSRLLKLYSPRKNVFLQYIKYSRQWVNARKDQGGHFVEAKQTWCWGEWNDWDLKRSTERNKQCSIFL